MEKFSPGVAYDEANERSWHRDSVAIHALLKQASPPRGLPASVQFLEPMSLPISRSLCIHR